MILHAWYQYNEHILDQHRLLNQGPWRIGMYVIQKIEGDVELPDGVIKEELRSIVYPTKRTRMYGVIIGLHIGPWWKHIGAQCICVKWIADPMVKYGVGRYRNGRVIMTETMEEEKKQDDNPYGSDDESVDRMPRQTVDEALMPEWVNPWDIEKVGIAQLKYATDDEVYEGEKSDETGCERDVATALHRRTSEEYYSLESAYGTARGTDRWFGIDRVHGYELLYAWYMEERVTKLENKLEVC